MTDPRGPIAVVVNPIHPRSRAAVDAVRAQAGGQDVLVFETTRDDPGPGQARAALEARPSVVVVCGGDGTVRLVAGELAGSGVPLGIVPSGTANLFARNLRLPKQLSRAVAIALHERPRRCDVGWATRATVAHPEGDREPFLVLAGIGHDAATVLATSDRLKRRVRWLAYFTAGVRHLLRPPLWFAVTESDADRRVRAWCILAASCGRLPGGARVFTDASPDDGVLHTLEVAPQRPWNWTGVAAKGWGIVRASSALRYGRAQALTIRPDAPTPCELDGDAVPDVVALAVTIEPGSLLVKAPSYR